MRDEPVAPAALRPIERRVLRLRAEGYDEAEIGRRFRKSPQAIGRLIAMSRLPRRSGTAHDTATVLRPLERRILRWLDAGVDHAEIGHRFNRQPGHIRQVERFARQKLEGSGISA